MAAIGPSPSRGFAAGPFLSRGRGDFDDLAQPFQDTLCIRHHVIIPKSRNAKTSCFQVTCAGVFLSRGFSMLATIYLDHEPFRLTEEIDDVWPDRYLTPKFQSFESTRAQTLPYALLSIGRVAPKPTRPTVTVGRNGSEASQWLSRPTGAPEAPTRKSRSTP